MKTKLLWMILLFAPAIASADILEWRDADGVRHYTNLASEVPRAHRDSAQIVVDELVHRSSPAAEETAAQAPPSESGDAEPGEARRDRTSYDNSASSAYLAGMERGMDAVRGFASGGSVQINGPLVDGGSTVAMPYEVWPTYQSPLVTTSFDRGRSRFRTLRLLLDDLFTADREGPYIVDSTAGCHELPAIAAQPILVRGLPRSTVPAAARIIQPLKRKPGRPSR